MITSACICDIAIFYLHQSIQVHKSMILSTALVRKSLKTDKRSLHERGEYTAMKRIRKKQRCMVYKPDELCWPRGNGFICLSFRGRAQEECLQFQAMCGSVTASKVHIPTVWGKKICQHISFSCFSIY